VRVPAGSTALLPPAPASPKIAPNSRGYGMIERLKALLARGPADPRPEAEPPRPRAVEVGWLLDTDKARFIWPEPRRVKRADPAPTHAKSVNYCPSVLDHEARMFEVTCPIDVRLGFRRDDKGMPVLVNADGDRSSIRSKHLNAMLALVNQREWRHPDRPVVQIITPYVFVSDEPVFMTQMPPISHYQPDPWPGTMIGGRLPIHIWPRQMMWAFEWYDTSRELVLRRGEPWFYVRFETHDPGRPVRLFEAERTPELDEHMKGMSAVANYVDRTYSLLKVASARRPASLLKRKSSAQVDDAAG
jgi:hypothetical protein